MISVGVDVGGTKLEVLALDDAGVERVRTRVDTPVGDYQGVVDAIVGLIRTVESEVGPVATIGLGTPGTEDRRTGNLKHANSVALNGKPLRGDVATALGRPVAIANDADCLALSEAIDGAGAGFRSVFAVIIGTGVGGGLVVRDKLVTGPNGLGGEWGHNPLPGPRGAEHDGLACYCGQHGCIETWLSGPGLEADHARITGDELSGSAIAEAARSGSAPASATLERYADRLSRGLAAIINSLDPEVIVLGGGVSNIDELYTMVPALWGRYVFGGAAVTPLRRASHGDSSGVRGAVFVGRDEDLLHGVGDHPG